MKASVALTVKNESLHIKQCLEAILHQNVSDFEIILVDDNSTDGTLDIVHSFQDKRIKVFNAINEPGHANLRNFTVKKACGKYIFFVDGDCVPHHDWMKTALNLLENEDCVGIEGRTFYEAKGSVTVSDYYTQRVIPEGYMTCNVAYIREAIEKVGYFDPKFKYIYEDRDLGIRIKKIGNILFEPNMLVFHQQKKLNLKTLFRRSKRAGDMVYFDFKHGRNASEYIQNNILYRNHLLIILFPPLILLGTRNESLYDLAISFCKYLGFIQERFLIWKKAIKYKRFIV